MWRVGSPEMRRARFWRLGASWRERVWRGRVRCSALSWMGRHQMWLIGSQARTKAFLSGLLTASNEQDSSAIQPTES